METIVEVCIFKREQDSKIERGIAITIGNELRIVDCNHRVVPTLWNYSLLPHEGCFITECQFDRDKPV